MVLLHLELAVSAYSAYTGNAEIAIGNVVGSNIVNILLYWELTNFSINHLEKYGIERDSPEPFGSHCTIPDDQ
ncbi:MAG: hypothetical protein IPJ13_04295 [Saprospiraceae bacterium]|nr:hypothetical protein [Saprospiraceae bacterium]